MSTIIGVPQCSTKWGNTGQPACDIKIDHLQHLAIHFDGFEVSDSDLDDWNNVLAALQQGTMNPIATRLFPVKNIYATEDATEAPAKMTSGYGRTAAIMEKPHHFDIELENVGVEFFKRLRKFNGNKKLRVFWVDKTFIGGKKTSTGWTGMECDWHLNQVKPGNIADYTKYILQLELTDPKALTDNLAPIVFPDGFDFDVEVAGITDVTLSGTIAVKTATINAFTSIARTNFFKDYASQLAAGAFLVNGVAPSTEYVGVDANGVVTFTFLTAGVKQIELNTPEELAEFLMIGSYTSGGFESNVLTLTAT